MKRLIMSALIFFTVNTFAQERTKRNRDGHQKRELFKSMTAEEIAELQTKRMTLDLNLTDSQKDEIYKMRLAEAKERKSKAETHQKQMQDGNKKTRSKEDRVKRLNSQLDSRIANKKQMRKVLNDEQFTRWERQGKRSQHKRKTKRSKGNKRHKRN